MNIKIFPWTGGDHIGFMDNEGRRYIIDFTKGPKLKLLGEGATPDPSIVSEHAFEQGDPPLKVTDVQEEDVRYTVVVDEKPSDLTLTKTEVATLANAMPIGVVPGDVGHGRVSIADGAGPMEL
jgi:hypothetical protein